MYKKRVLPILTLLIFIIGIGGGLRAEEVEKGKTLSLEKAIQIALESSPRVKQSANQVEISSITVKQKKANFLPELNASTGTSERLGKSFDAQTGITSNTASNSVSFNASTSVNLFNGFSDKASLEQARLDLKSSSADFDRMRQTIIYETIQRYIQAVTSRDAIGVEKENLEAQKLLLTRIEDYNKAGKRPITDVYQQKAQVSNAEYQFLNAQRNYEVNKLLLMQTMGVQPESEFEVVDPGIENLLIKLKDSRDEEALKKALTNRPDLLSQEYSIDAAYNGITIARAGYYPKLSFSASFGTSYSSQTRKILNFGDQFFKKNINGSFGLSLSIPVFDKFRTKYSVATAQVSLKNQQIELDRLKQQVGLEVQQAIRDYDTAAKQLEVSDDQLRYSKDALDSTQERYEVSASTLIELTQARAQYIQALYNRLQARLNLLVRGIAVSYYKGDENAMISLVNSK